VPLDDFLPAVVVAVQIETVFLVAMQELVAVVLVLRVQQLQTTERQTLVVVAVVRV
jgi:uncharacterized protein (UPF0212 family)